MLRRLPSPNGPRIAFATVWGESSPILTALESILAVAIRLRGADASSLMCDRAFPACVRDSLGNHSMSIPAEYALSGLTPHRCRRCVHVINAYYKQSPIRQEQFSRFTQTDDLARIMELVDRLPQERYQTHVYRDIHVGEHAYASAVRETGRGTLMDSPYHWWLFRRHLIASILISDLTERMFQTVRPDRLVAPHGIYVDHGTICEVARREQIPVVVFSVSYRKDTIMLCHGDTYHKALVTEPHALWENMELSDTQRERLAGYADSRRRGTHDILTYHPSPVEEHAKIIKEIGLDMTKPVISLFSNVMWDAQLYHSYNAFENMLDWVLKTIDYFLKRPDLQLVIRVHPAEIKAEKKSMQPLKTEIENRYPSLPQHIKIVGPESDISSYSLVDISKATLIYGTKMGLEIALRGVPVIIAGESMNRGKGFTFDVESVDGYFQLLDRLSDIPRNTPEMMERAEKYGYHFYFRRQIDFPFLTDFQPGFPEKLKLTFDDLSALLPGRNDNLDLICDGILNGTEFVVP
ncbi:MAG: capsule biosynthesis protein [Anaerolineae bacterium]|nr:capsule biosynthesis protein [Anaerolineae bacterium]